MSLSSLDENKYDKMFTLALSDRSSTNAVHIPSYTWYSG